MAPKPSRETCRPLRGKAAICITFSDFKFILGRKGELAAGQPSSGALDNGCTWCLRRVSVIIAHRDGDRSRIAIFKEECAPWAVRLVEFGTMKSEPRKGYSFARLQYGWHSITLDLDF